MGFGFSLKHALFFWYNFKPLACIPSQKGPRGFKSLALVLAKRRYTDSNPVWNAFSIFKLLKGGRTAVLKTWSQLWDLRISSIEALKLKNKSTHQHGKGSRENQTLCFEFLCHFLPCVLSCLKFPQFYLHYTWGLGCLKIPSAQAKCNVKAKPGHTAHLQTP